MFDWATLKDAPIQESLAQQKEYVRAEFERRMQQAVLALNEQGLNVALYWSNPDPRKYVNIVPTSAITGEGVFRRLIDVDSRPFFRVCLRFTNC